MRRLPAIALLFSLCGCNFAVKHPAVTAGVVAGTVALGTCELASTDDKKCFITSGAVGVGLGLIAGGALWLGSEDEPAPVQQPPPTIDWSKVPDTTPKQPTKPPPPLPPGDAGVPATTPDAAPPADAAGVPADAGP